MLKIAIKKIRGDSLKTLITCKIHVAWAILVPKTTIFSYLLNRLTHGNFNLNEIYKWGLIKKTSSKFNSDASVIYYVYTAV